MARTSDQVLAEISADILPTGWAWDHSAGSNTMGSFRALADFAAQFEADAEAQLEEAVPYSSQALLGAYERVLERDPCLGDPSLMTFGQLRQSVSTRWTATADASIAGIIALAAGYGVTITITEMRRNCAGVLRAGNPVRCHPEQFTWLITLPTTVVVKFRAGASRAGEPLGAIQRNTTIECLIRRLAPSHTVPVFSYRTAGIGIGIYGASRYGDGSTYG